MRSASLVFLLATLLLSSCFRENYVVRRDGGDYTTKKAPDYEEWNHHFLWGLIPSKSIIDIDAVCPEGVQRVERRETFWNGLVAQLTFGIYTPSRARAWCVDGASATSDSGRPPVDMVNKWESRKR